LSIIIYFVNGSQPSAVEPLFYHRDVAIARRLFNVIW